MLRCANWVLSHRSSLEESSQETHPTVVVLTEENASAMNANMDKQAATSGLTANPLFFIRIELSRKSIWECARSDPVLEPSIVLHNFGSSHAALASIASSIDMVRAHAQPAYVLCNFAKEIMQEHMNAVAGFEHSEEFLSYFLPISILILRTLVDLAITIGMPLDAGTHSLELVSRQRHLSSMSLVLDQSTWFSAAAA